VWNKKAKACGYCPATISNEDAEGDASYRSCEDIITDWGWTCQEVIDMVGESLCSQCPSCDITADDGDGGDACSGLARKKCKKTAGCAYKKKTCISCSELSKKKCKKTDGCKWKNDECKTKGGDTGGLTVGDGSCKDNTSKNSCKEAGCKWKNDKCKQKK